MVDLQAFPDQKVVLPPANPRCRLVVDSWSTAKRSKRARRDPEKSVDEDLAVCLVMLARGSGNHSSTTSTAKTSQEVSKPTTISTDPSQEERKPTAGTNSSAAVDAKKHQEGSTPATPQPPVQTKSYNCRICNKFFPSFQALGGHKASHSNKPRRPIAATALYDSEPSYNISAFDQSGDLHKCGICGKTFLTGQALGGHKRAHFGAVIGAAKIKGPNSSQGQNPSSDVTDCCATGHDDVDCLTVPVPRNFDLNLPPPSAELELNLVFN